MKYSNFLLSLGFLLFGTFSSSCEQSQFEDCIRGEGAIVTQTLNFKRSINSISLASTGTLIVKQG
ncbi:MAG: hypothetical protein AAF806_30010, partial [Bacteroidota bacterium]